MSAAEQQSDEEVVVGIRSSHVGIVGVLLALSACGPASTGDQPASTSNSGGGVQFAVSQTCSPGSGGACEVVGDEHVLVNP